MPLHKIPTLKQAESKLRVCKGMLYVLEIERETLISLYRDGEMTQQEIVQCLMDVNADIQRLLESRESTRIIYRQISVA